MSPNPELFCFGLSLLFFFPVLWWTWLGLLLNFLSLFSALWKATTKNFSYNIDVESGT